MTPWELAACVKGWNAAQDGEAVPEPMTDHRFEQLKREAGLS